MNNFKDLITQYKPIAPFKNGHFNTIFTNLFKITPKSKYTRKRIETQDGDFLDLDMKLNNSREVVILIHGLEGSSQSTYIRSAANLLGSMNLDVCAMNLRNCSGVENKSPQQYHSGFTEDVHECVLQLENRYEGIHLVGFSLGGNLVLKYLGEERFEKSHKIKSGAGISVPLELHSSSLKLKQWYNYLYTRRFLLTLSTKIKQKQKQFPEIYTSENLKKVRNLFDFDEYYTAPLNNFKNALDYYDQNSSLQFLKGIKVPALIINAKDDPFISELCFPKPERFNHNSNILTLYPEHGGHVGFYKAGLYCWHEIVLSDFIKFLRIV